MVSTSSRFRLRGVGKRVRLAFAGTPYTARRENVGTFRETPLRLLHLWMDVPSAEAPSFAGMTLVVVAVFLD